MFTSQHHDPAAMNTINADRQQPTKWPDGGLQGLRQLAGSLHHDQILLARIEPLQQRRGRVCRKRRSGPHPTVHAERIVELNDASQCLGLGMKARRKVIHAQEQVCQALVDLYRGLPASGGELLHSTLYSGRQDMGKHVAGHTYGVRNTMGRAVMAGNETPQAAVHNDRQAHRSRDLNVAQVFNVDGRHTAQHGVAQVERLLCWLQRVDDHLCIVHIGNKAQRIAYVERTCLYGDVRGRKPTSQEGLQFLLAFLGHDFATVIRVKTVGHYTVETGELPDRGHCLSQQSGNVLAGTQLRHAAMRKQRKSGQIDTQQGAAFQLDDQSFIVEMKHSVVGRVIQDNFHV